MPTVVKLVFSLVPTVVTAPMITTAMSATIKPYSMAVAPAWSAAKRLMSLNMALCPLMAGMRLPITPNIRDDEIQLFIGRY